VSCPTKSLAPPTHCQQPFPRYTQRGRLPLAVLGNTDVTYCVWSLSGSAWASLGVEVCFGLVVSIGWHGASCFTWNAHVT
jgi:hypothetical protein